MLLRYRAAEVFDRARLPPALLSLRHLAGVSPWITVLSYHRVAPASAVGDFDDGTVDVTPEAFDLQVAFAKKWFDVIGIEDLISFAHGGALPKNPLLFTFDDGYLDNHRAAVPILQKHGARATFFIATTYVSERRLFWWDRLSYMVKRSTRDRLDLTYPVTASLPLTSNAERTGAFRALRGLIIHHVGIDLWRFLDAVAEASGVELTRDDERRYAEKMILTWDDVKDMRAAGMDIQSHTCNHYVLPTLTDAQVRAELRESREILQGILKEPIRAISYPVGKGVGEKFREEVRSAGYEIGFSNASGINHRWAFDPLSARRLSLDIDSPLSYFRSMMALPYI